MEKYSLASGLYVAPLPGATLVTSGIERLQVKALEGLSGFQGERFGVEGYLKSLPGTVTGTSKLHD